mmetsp:Transcript_30184/g.66942  ORF Transcript_30184/g.66942 Transcript_30184/m.66942 type:complete len:243 (-) Transcript_30184:27-755(-)
MGVGASQLGMPLEGLMGYDSFQVAPTTPVSLPLMVLTARLGCTNGAPGVRKRGTWCGMAYMSRGAVGPAGRPVMEAVVYRKVRAGAGLWGLEVAEAEATWRRPPIGYRSALWSRITSWEGSASRARRTTPLKSAAPSMLDTMMPPLRTVRTTMLVGTLVYSSQVRPLLKLNLNLVPVRVVVPGAPSSTVPGPGTSVRVAAVSTTVVYGWPCTRVAVMAPRAPNVTPICQLSVADSSSYRSSA